MTEKVKGKSAEIEKKKSELNAKASALAAGIPEWNYWAILKSSKFYFMHSLLYELEIKQLQSSIAANREKRDQILAKFGLVQGTLPYKLGLAQNW